MWIHEVAPERLAELFYHYHHALKPETTSKGSEDGADWSRVSQKEKIRLVAAARLALLELDSATQAMPKSRSYFAAPGEAEWGC